MSGRGDGEEIIVPAQAPPSGTTVRHGAGENGHTSMFYSIEYFQYWVHICHVYSIHLWIIFLSSR